MVKEAATDCIVFTCVPASCAWRLVFLQLVGCGETRNGAGATKLLLPSWIFPMKTIMVRIYATSSSKRRSASRHSPALPAPEPPDGRTTRHLWWLLPGGIGNLERQQKKTAAAARCQRSCAAAFRPLEFGNGAAAGAKGTSGNQRFSYINALRATGIDNDQRRYQATGE